MKILIAIPCYNCSDQIGRLLSELDPVLSSIDLIVEVAIIDNRSVDKTIETAKKSIQSFSQKTKYHLYQNHENVGLGGTHKIAFHLAQKSTATHLVIFHGDHQAQSEDLKKIILLSNKSAGITVLGSRFMNLKLLKGYSFIRIAGNICLNFLYSIFTGKKIIDLGSGLNLFKVDDFDLNRINEFDNGFTFNMDLLLYCVFNKINFVYFEIHWSTTDQVSNAKALSVGWKTLIKLFQWRIGLRRKNNYNLNTELISYPT